MSWFHLSLPLSEQQDVNTAPGRGAMLPDLCPSVEIFYLRDRARVHGDRARTCGDRARTCGYRSRNHRHRERTHGDKARTHGGSSSGYNFLSAALEGGDIS